MTERAWGPRAADTLVVAALIAVPLATSSAFVDQYTTVKWYLLHGIAAAWLLVEIWLCGSRGWPSLVRERPSVFVALAVVAAWSGLRSGPERALAPMVDRVASVVLCLCASWWFARNRGRTMAMAAALAASAAATIALGLLQAGGFAVPASLAATEGPAALFGNVNMAAQFVGLALLVVSATPLAAPGRAARVAWNAVRVLVGLAGAIYLYGLSTRSVVLAVAVAAAALAWGTRRRFLPLLAAVTAGSVLALIWRQPWARLDPEVTLRKASSIEVRLAVWRNTLSMVRDHPLGVGTANFEHVFPPYHARGPLPPWEALVFRGPHNEYLRYLAEDGPLFCAIAIVIVAMLVARWRHAPDAASLRIVVVGWGAFLAVESLFQFPLALAFGALAAAMVLGAMLAVPGVGSPPAPSRGWPWRAGGTLAAIALVAASARVARSESLHVKRPDDLSAQRRACALDRRNLPACVTAAWLEVRAGDMAAARRDLSSVLAATPHYAPALKLKGEIEALEGNDAEACRLLGAYDALYRGESSVRESAAEACARAR